MSHNEGQRRADLTLKEMMDLYEQGIVEERLLDAEGNVREDVLANLPQQARPRRGGARGSSRGSVGRGGGATRGDKPNSDGGATGGATRGGEPKDGGGPLSQSEIVRRDRHKLDREELLRRQFPNEREYQKYLRSIEGLSAEPPLEQEKDEEQRKEGPLE